VTAWHAQQQRQQLALLEQTQHQRKVAQVVQPLVLLLEVISTLAAASWPQQG
jgi:hypothetical protein